MTTVAVIEDNNTMREMLVELIDGDAGIPLRLRLLHVPRRLSLKCPNTSPTLR